MRNSERAERILTEHGVRVTSVRLLVFNAIMDWHDTFTLNDVTDSLESVDKSSVFRALTLFAEHHLLHVSDDGSGSKKYCRCRNGHECGMYEYHCHFYCESCGKTYCMDDTFVPAVNMPDGFVAASAEYVVKGVCAMCGRRLRD